MRKPNTVYEIRVRNPGTSWQPIINHQTGSVMSWPSPVGAVSWATSPDFGRDILAVFTDVKIVTVMDNDIIRVLVPCMTADKLEKIAVDMALREEHGKGKAQWSATNGDKFVVRYDEGNADCSFWIDRAGSGEELITRDAFVSFLSAVSQC